MIKLYKIIIQITNNDLKTINIMCKYNGNNML